MAISRISQSFKDISLSFERHPITNDILVLKNEDAIKRSIRNIIETIPGERFFNSKFGSPVSRSLFDFIDFGTASTIQTQVEVAIQNYEPRVENPRIEVFPRPNENSFEINVYYDIVGKEFGSQKFSYILEATRR